MQIRPPETPAEWEAYYRLRFEILRQPWGQAPGTERLPDEAEATHAAAFDTDGTLLGVGRLQQNSPTQGQVRLMAVSPAAQGRGVGKAIVQYLEDQARQQGLTEIVLEARQNAVAFYEGIGYEIRAKSHLLFGEIQHWTMQKKIAPTSLSAQEHSQFD
ncbi:MAG: GNAT family N-acetyltransferase [Cytophagaceae bacterium]|nr:GNAT family N-acetyltransferase [Cytophagaceae bacterium]